MHAGSVIRLVDENEGDAMWLELDDDGTWFGARWNWLPLERFAELVRRAGGAKVLEKLERVAKQLRLDLDAM